MKDIFEVKRFGNVMRKDALESYRTTAIASAATAAVILVAYAISVYAGNAGAGSVSRYVSNEVHPFHLSIFSLILFLGGIVVTSRAFVDVHSRVKNHDWLLMPASTLEKFVERLLATGIIYALGTLVGYFLVSTLFAGIASLVAGNSLPVVNPFHADLWMPIAHYLVAHSVFLLGAAYFRKNNLLKTVLTLVLLGIGLSIFTALVVRIVYWNSFRELFIEERINYVFDGIALSSRFGVFVDRLGKGFSIAGSVVYWGVIAPLCWTVAYLRIGETEVKDGI